jgi:hypothetical protein
VVPAVGEGGVRGALPVEVVHETDRILGCPELAQGAQHAFAHGGVAGPAQQDRHGRSTVGVEAEGDQARQYVRGCRERTDETALHRMQLVPQRGDDTEVAAAAEPARSGRSPRGDRLAAGRRARHRLDHRQPGPSWAGHRLTSRSVAVLPHPRVKGSFVPCPVGCYAGTLPSRPGNGEVTTTRRDHDRATDRVHLG